jgi:enoyl-CoA hydratase
MSPNPVLVKRLGAVVMVTMNRADKRNALSRAMAGALTEAVRSAQDAAVIVLTGADPAFCAGLDLAEAAQSGYINPGWLQRTFLDSAVPLIAAVNGPAITAGLEIALACDFIIASDRARFADTHGLVGTVPGGGITVRLAERTTTGFARQMSYTGIQVDAATALRAGLVNEVHDHERLLPAALDVGRRIAALPSPALRTIKRMYDEVGRLSPDSGLAQEREIFGEFTAANEAAFAEFHERLREQPSP